MVSTGPRLASLIVGQAPSSSVVSRGFPSASFHTVVVEHLRTERSAGTGTSVRSPLPANQFSSSIAVTVNGQCRLCGILMYLPWGDATFDMDRSGYGPAILHRDLQRSSRNTSDLSKDATHYIFTAKGGGYRCRRGRVIRRRRGQSSNDPEGETGDYLGTDLVVARRGIAGHSKCSLAKGSEAFDRAHTIAIKV